MMFRSILASTAAVLLALGLSQPAEAGASSLVVAQAQQPALGMKRGPAARMAGPMGMMADRMQQSFRMMDKNGDGTLTPDEVGGNHAGMFAIIDADNDGFLTKDEYFGFRRGAGRMPMSDRAMQWRESNFDALDRDGDGKLSKDEWSAAGDWMFDLRDRNADGKLTPGEMGPMMSMGGMGMGRRGMGGPAPQK
jgi:Ca2+-binding EF-hand superfamily protein